MSSALKCFILICEAMATLDPVSCQDIHMTIQRARLHTSTEFFYAQVNKHIVFVPHYFKIH